MVYITSVYKVFGQSFIFDDHYLALVGAAAAAAGCLGRILLGFTAELFPCKVF